MAVDRSAVEEVFRAARADFKLELISWLADVDQVMASMTADSGDEGKAAGLNRVRELAHKIAGSSGSFGLKGVSDAALPLEKYCIAVSGAGEAISDDIVGQLSGLIAKVQAALDDHNKI